MNQNPDPYQQNPYDSSQQYPPQPPAQTDPYGSAGAPPPPLDPTQYASPGSTTQGNGYPPQPLSGPGNLSGPYPPQPLSGPGNPSGPYPPQPLSGSGYSGTNPPYGMSGQPNYYQTGSEQGYPGYTPPQQPKKKRTWLWILLGVIGVILIGTISICAIAVNGANQFLHSTQATVTADQTSIANNTGSTPDASTGVTPTVATNTGNGASTPTSGGGTTDSGGTIALGQAHVFANVSCTAASAKVIPGDQYTQPDSGHEFVEISITIKNNSSVNYDYNEFDFYAISQGDTTQESFIYPESVPTDSTLDSGTVDPGQTVTGNLIIQIHTDDHNAILKWQPSYNTAVDYEWKLSV